ncbi:unnamed protein product [Didymodactylos carnosus]|uniref:Prokaryotic glutathione synthetase ATP-binding domain-containing protein n=1 Tax=Didymodactylos carnosus TaxID=1234261 RepID=A0A815YUY7_9BILA|nr:unnamed protein product [Didymodactylos carnosus]CAF1574577.1 unnamed protein product [Didymodactylos carnosus]CAF3524520.1 unnamed protein product [Didymodactylos carnosus]CAF4439171.1 unnamed protein product [Didymodactylos carnosus]
MKLMAVLVEDVEIDQSSDADDDILMLKHLQSLGYEYKLISWHSPPASLDHFDLCLVRIAYGYHTSPDAFLQLIKRFNEAGVTVLNPPKMINWNYHKKYLLELRNQGFLLPSTYLIEQTASAPKLSSIMAETDIYSAVIKPAISASATSTFRITLPVSSDMQKNFEEILEKHDVLVQEFMTEIAQGEISLIYLSGQYKYAVKKIPKTDGGWLVQSEHGGRTIEYQAEQNEIKVGDKIMYWLEQKFGKFPLYARIDGIKTENGFSLMEVELIEPGLFFSKNAAKIALFGHALTKYNEA